MKCYKFTDQNGQTRNGTQWGEGVTNIATGNNSQCLCSDGWIHFYTSPLIAVIMIDQHANFKSPKLWEAKSEGKHLHEPLKSGCERLTTIKELPLPTITTTQRVAFAILCSLEAASYEGYIQWAYGWLDGTDRTEHAARAAANAATNAAASAAARAAYAFSATASAANAASAADATAYVAATCGIKINFNKLAKKAMSYV